MSTVLFLESVAGVAGDMFSAAFVDAGIVTREELSALPAQVGLPGVRIEIEKVTRASVHATHLRVIPGGDSALFAHSHGHPHAGEPHAHAMPGEHSDDPHLVIPAPADHAHTHFTDIDRMLEQSQLEPRVRDFARRVFRLLAEAEAAAHGMPVEDVAFHEIGAIDSIMDVVMAAYCLDKVDGARCVATPIRPGRGVVKMAHGVHPVPPPASARLLQGLAIAGVPAAVSRENLELSTPTGIAILKALAPEFAAELPAGTVQRHGMGAGTMDLGAFPNVFRVFLLNADTLAALSRSFEADRVIEIVTNVDDDTGEHMGWMAERLMAQGALDVWMVPATGKKTRPMVCLHVLCAEAAWRGLADWILRNSTTFGLRYRHWDRVTLPRRFETRSTPKGAVTYKLGLTRSGEVLKEKVEFEQERRNWEQREKLS